MADSRFFFTIGLLQKVFAGGAVLLGSALVALSCGGDEATGSAGGGPGCSIGGSKCQYGCTASLGCTECATDLDCKDAGKPACVLGKCHECEVSADCATGQACFPKDHKCMPACAGDGDCPGDAPICKTDTGACLGCLADADCASIKDAPVCEPTRAQCSACASNADCGAAAPACDLSDGKCHECLVDSNCSAPSLCGVDRKCHATCLLNSDCTDVNKPICDLSSKDCVECLSGSDCPASAPACSAGNKCVACVVNLDCKDPAAPICQGDKCVGCAASADCADPLKPVCKGGACVQCDKDTDCIDPAFPKCSNQQCGPA